MRIFRSKVLHLSVAMLLAFVPLALLVPVDILYLYTGCILITTTMVFVHSYWPAMRMSLRTTATEMDDVDILTLALFVVFVANGVHEAYTTFVREILPLMPGHGRSTTYFIFPSFLQYAALVSGLLAVAARNTRPTSGFLQHVPGWPRGVTAVVTGVGLATIFLIARY